MNGKPNGNGNGVGGVLTTLASSGDNWVKLLIVAGLILNTVMTKHNGSGIKENGKEVVELRAQVARQVRVIYHNQSIYLAHIKRATADHDAMLNKLGLPPGPRVIVPEQEILPEFEQE